MQRWLRRIRPGANAAEPVAAPAPAYVTLPFTEIEGALALYVTALSDGTLRVAATGGANSGSYTDGRTIFFPTQVDSFPERSSARRLYRLMAAWKVLQARSGSLDVRPVLALDNPAPAMALYEVIHGEWLDRQLVTTWPGLGGDLALLRADALRRQTLESASNGAPGPIEALLRGLLARRLDEPLAESELPALGGGLLPSALIGPLWAALTASSPAVSRELALDLARRVAPDEPSAVSDSPNIQVHYRGRIRFDLVRDWTPLVEETTISSGDAPPPRHARSHTPLVVEASAPQPRIVRERRASSGGRQAVQLSLGDREPTLTFKPVPLTDAEKQGALLYDEWDYRRNAYEREWCAVHLRHARGGSSEAVEKILRQNAPLILRLKQQFEALRPERQRLTRQLDGDDLDLSAMVEAHADHRAGFSPSEKLYSLTLRRERNIALGCLVDLSGSTGAWIDDDPRNDQVIEVTRRALVFLCEALTMLDDRYALFGFTSSTRKHCDVSIIKGFDEQYGQTVKGRIAGLAPGSYTRIGPAIRHTAQALTQQPARVRLLLLISDGRPNDFDGYGGRYGIEDTRKALIEARQRGVSTFALTIDAEARDYMPHMFGRGHYVVVENTPALAVKLADLYRRLTIQ